MTRCFLASGVLLLGLLAAPARAAQDAVLLYPPDLTLSLQEKVKVFWYLPEKGAPDNVTVNGLPASPLEGETFPKGELTLFPGFNLVHALRGKTVRLFFLQNARMEQLKLPTGKEGEEMIFQAYRLHPALDDGCEGCHAVEGGKLARKDQKEACYACHNDFSKAEDRKKVFLHQFSLGPYLRKEYREQAKKLFCKVIGRRDIRVQKPRYLFLKKVCVLYENTLAFKVDDEGRKELFRPAGLKPIILSHDRMFSICAGFALTCHSSVEPAISGYWKPKAINSSMNESTRGWLFWSKTPLARVVIQSMIFD